MFRKSFKVVSSAAVAFVAVALNGQAASAALAVDVTGGLALIRGTFATSATP